MPGLAFADKSAVVADQSTLDTWVGHVRNSTENVGRIWTDKTVQTDDITLSGSTSGSIKVDKADGADFLVGLSALSSTSNLTSVSGKPLDIVLVMDESYSMRQTDSEESYVEVYADNLDTSKTYYYYDGGFFGGSYEELQWNAQENEWGYYGGVLGGRWNSVTPKAFVGDRQGTQFYEKIGGLSRIEALKNAANDFIDYAVDANKELSGDLQHRIALVTYADEARIEKHLTYANPQNAAELHSIVNEVNYEDGGNTYSNKGMESARQALSDARENAQQVVIFFTDGEPSKANRNWDADLAAGAINTANTMKESGVIIYSVGMVEGADPSDTSQNINKFMNAVSSNYPNATATYSGWQQGGWGEESGWNTLNVTWGDNRVEGDYYKAATDAASLNRIFQEIFDEQATAAGSPTQVDTEEGFAGANGGYITFTDTLGDYMEVKGDTATVVFANQEFTGQKSGVADDGSYTYTFESQVSGNPVYPNANLSNLIMKVTPGVNGKGDTVEVKIPAQLIPLRNYTVKTENGSTTFETDEAYPIRVFYSVGLQDGVQDKVNNPDNAMSAYIAANKTEDGTVAFYSNDWNRDAKTAGTTATFTPASTNKFYYFTQDTPLYTDEGCTKRATRNDIEGRQTETVYYKNEFYTQDGTVGTAQTEAIAIPVSVFQSQHANNWSADSDGNAFMKAGAPRLNRTNDFIAEKDSNITGTAGRFISPSWNDDQSGIVVSLGNNGKVPVEQGATLEVKKNITAAEGFDASSYTDTDFTFDMAFENVPDGVYKAEVKQNGAVVSDPGFAVDVSDGKAAHAIKPNQVLYIYGLPAGGAYNVTEQPVAGFTQVADQTTGTVGTFAAGEIATAQFVNEYKAAETQLADGTLKVRKGFTGRDWRDGDEFAFTIGTTDSAPLPNPATVTVSKNTADHTAAFGAITYTKPGEYRYSITEQRGNLVGVNYSAAQWRVIVRVVDNGDGTMTATPEVEKLTGDDGIELVEPEIADGNTAVFNNVYTIDSDAVLNLEGTKGYTDNSVAEGGQGGNPIDQNKFTFQLKAKGGYVTDGGSDQNLTISAADVPMPLGAEGTTMQQGNVADAFNFPDIIFGPACVGNTYVYEVAEVAGTEESMSYDKTVYTVKVEVTEETEGEGDDAHAHITATPTYSTAEGDADAIAFANSYTPDSATLSGDTAVTGTKTMTGRDMLEGEEFTFRLTPTGNTVAAINNGTVRGITTDGLTSTAAKGGEDGVAVDFNFGDIAFTKVGTYTFAMSENVPAEADKAGGVNYDTHDCTVTVNVTLNKETGALEAAVDYGTNVDAAGNAFTNVYTASMSYGNAGGLAVAKTTQGRPMFAGEFEFTIEGVASDTVSAADANAKLSDKDKRFTNGDSAEGAEWSAAKLLGLTFTQSDAGKTYSYIVDEVPPAQQKPSLTYDQNTYRVDIEVVDDLDGTMHTVTKVHRTANAEGELGTPELVGTYNSDEGQAAKVSFTNVYEPTPAVLEDGTALSVTKKVEGADTDARFDFTLRLTSNNAANVEGLDENGEMTASTSGTLADGSSTPISFGTLTFVEAGEYTFEVTENQGGQGVDGWTYDESTYTITVTVSPRNAQDEYDGALHVNAVSGNNPTFTNSYKAEPVIVGGDDATQHLSVEKTVEGKGTEADFNFTLSKVNPDDAKWNNVEAAEGADKASVTENFGAGDKKTANFGMFTFKAKGIYQFQVVEDEAQGDAPAGWTYDAASKTIAVEVTDNGKGQLVATIDGVAAFTNTYDAEAATGVPAGFQLAKVFEGREWTDDYAFEFTLTPVGDAPMPTDAEGNAVDTVVVNAPTEDDGKTAKFDFGAIEYAAAGTYEYEVNEVAGGNAGIAYATNTAKVEVTVTDLGAGKLVASATVADGTFVNTYDTGEVDFDTVAGGGLEIVKNLTGHAIKAGQFDFRMEGQDQASIDKLGGNKEYTTGDAELDGNIATDVVPVSTGLVFEKADAGKTYTYKVSEIDDGAKGYTYDDTVYDLRFAVSDGGDGALTVDVYVNGELAATHTGEAASRAASEPVQLAFDNAYEADSATVGGEGEAQIVASKELIGRPMADGEFSFVVTDKNGAEVARGTNAADGTVAFDPIVYTTEKLNSDAASGAATRTEGADGVAVYAYQYIVAEDEASLDGGVAAVEKSFSFAVEVTDDGEGALTAKVSQPEMAFVNTYGASESAAISIKGAKALDAADGLTPPDITGKFSFTMKGSGGAPMPEGSSGDAKTVANDAFGNVDFGKIVYTMENVFGSEAAAPEEPTVDEATGEAAEVAPMAAQRTKTFAYEITESGSVAGVVNDAEVKTIEVTVTDNGDGTLDVAKSTAGEATDFTFVNTYSVRPTDPVSPTDPSVEGAVKVTKQLTGRELVEGEFAFELRDERGTLVSEGVSDAEGNVSLGGIAFMAPGTYKFELSEVVPEGDLEGVTYDGTIHPLTATVTDNGDGTMSVAWSASSEEIVFRNSYVAAPASVTLGAAKVLEGAELADGQFTFQMLDRDGEVFREARNDEGGAVTFPTVEFTQAGTYTYTIVEVDDGQEGVAYDDARHEVVVTVTDDGEGHLTASVEGAEDMAFCNAYAAPVGPGPKPLPPAGDDGGALVRTGDAAPAAAIAGAALAAAALGVAALAAARLRRARRFGGGRDALE